MSWNKQLSVGNTIVDSEHKHLISLVNQVERAMKTAMELRDGAPLLHSFDQLEDELLHHFRNEEKIAGAIHFPFDEHMKAQEHMLTELHYLRSELMAKDCIWTGAALEHFCEFLDAWMTEHITKTDMPMKSVLQGYDYNFWPDWERASPANDTPPPAARTPLHVVHA